MNTTQSKATQSTTKRVWSLGVSDLMATLSLGQQARRMAGDRRALRPVSHQALNGPFELRRIPVGAGSVALVKGIWASQGDAESECPDVDELFAVLAHELYQERVKATFPGLRSVA